VKVAILVHWQGRKLMVGAIEGLERSVIVVLAVVAVVIVILIVLTVVVAVSQMREIRRALIYARPRAADLQLPGFAPRRAVEGVGFVLVHV
jgi:hypothetical protein